MAKTFARRCRCNRCNGAFVPIGDWEENAPPRRLFQNQAQGPSNARFHTRERKNQFILENPPPDERAVLWRIPNLPYYEWRNAAL